MTMAGGSTGHSLDFLLTACKGYVGDRIELKFCEGGFCGGQRLRRKVPKFARDGAKFCESCALRINRATEAERSQIRVLVRPTLEQHWNQEVAKEMARLRA